MSLPPDDGWDEAEVYDDEAPARGGGLRVVAPGEMDPLDYVAPGKLARTVGNGVILLRGSPEWAGLRWDKFRGEATLDSPPPLAGYDPPQSRIDGYTAAYVAHWLAKRHRLRLSEAEAARAAEYAAKSVGRAHHPVRAYLDALPAWDGVSRLGRFVSTHLGGEQTDYTAAVWRCWMISAVARVMRPGCQVHHVPILEGKQGSGKSTAIRLLAPDESWVNDSPIKIGDKDGMDALRGHWIVELAELESLSGRESAKVKSFITSATDTYRKAYGRDTERHERQCVMIGTVNPEEGYLVDPTGNRRFWPLRTGVIDLEAIERDRDQLWAEALSYYRDGAPWHLDSAALIGQAQIEQSEREVQDPWEETIREGLEAPVRRALMRGSGITTSYVLSDVLSVPTRDHTRASATRVGTILRRLGYTVTRRHGQQRRYVLAGTDGSEDDGAERIPI